MSIARRLTLPLMVAGVVVVLGAAAALAQVGPTNPSGGTSLQQTRTEGPMTGPAGSVSRDLSATTVWKGWFGAFAASREGFVFSGRTWVRQSSSAFLRRPAVNR